MGQRAVSWSGRRFVKWVIPTLFAVAALLVEPDAALSETIQLRQQGGTYLVPVRINDAITLDFLIDSGASEVTIPADVFLTLSRTHTVGQGDFLGTGKYILADGSTQASERFRLHEVRVGNHVISDVVANVAPVKSRYPLLGQTFLSKLSVWSIDNDRGVLILSDRGAPAASAAGTASANSANNKLLGLPTAAQAATLAKAVGNWCIGTEAFLMGVATAGRGAGNAYWSLRCANGSVWAVQINPLAEIVAVDCASFAANAAGKECFKKF